MVMMMMVMMKINERGRLELLWRLLWDGTLSSEMAALKKKRRWRNWRHVRMSKGRYTLGDKLQDHVAATNRFVCTGEFLRESLFLQQEFYRSNMSKKIKSDRIYATCCGDKNFVAEAKIFTKILEYTCMERFVTPICRYNVLLQLVARSVHTEWFVVATCRLVCFELKHRINQSQSGKWSAWSHAQFSRPNVAFSFEVALSQTLYG